MSTNKPTPSKPPSPTLRRRCDGRLIFESKERVPLKSALGVILRAAVARARSIEDCARLCGVSVEDLRDVSRRTGVPLLFPVASAGGEQ